MSSLIKTDLFSAGDEEAPVFHHTRKYFGRKIWYFRRYEDVKAILSNHELFTTQRTMIGMKWLERAYEGYEVSQSRFVLRTMLHIDPPDHTRIRRVVNKAFSPDRMNALRPFIQDVVDDLLDKLSNQEGGDILVDYTFPLTIRVLSKVLGLPETDHEWMLRMSEALKQPNDKLRNYLLFYKFSRHLKKIYDECKEDPHDNLLSMLVESEDSGEISYDEALQTFFFFILAGYITTTNFIANSILALFLHPDQMNNIKKSGAITETGIEELLRYGNVLRISQARFATANVSLGGVEIKRGDILLGLLNAADYDSSTFKHPEQLNLDRVQNPHLAFGYGIHFCVGAPLARLEGKIAINTILARFPNLRLGVELEELSRISGWHVGALQKLPVRWY